MMTKKLHKHNALAGVELWYGGANASSQYTREIPLMLIHDLMLADFLINHVKWTNKIFEIYDNGLRMLHCEQKMQNLILFMLMQLIIIC